MQNALVLFGAGASHGSDLSGTPPLGNDLFGALRRFNPQGWGQLSESLAQEFNTDFEAGMSLLAATASHNMPILQRAMAAYFFGFRPAFSSLYVQLARRVARATWHGVISSLNYERLLELSISASGLRPVVGRTASGGELELCLPHGCCHLFCEGVRASAEGVFFSGVGVSFDGEVSVVDNPTEFSQRIVGDAVPPVMSYFEPKKTTSAGVSFIQGQRQRWAQAAGSADVLAIVGVRVRPTDEHIWNPIAETSAKVVYCAGPSAGEEFRNWTARARPAADDVVLGGTFASEFESICRAIGA